MTNAYLTFLTILIAVMVSGSLLGAVILGHYISVSSVPDNIQCFAPVNLEN